MLVRTVASTCLGICEGDPVRHIGQGRLWAAAGLEVVRLRQHQWQLRLWHRLGLLQLSRKGLQTMIGITPRHAHQQAQPRTK